MSNFKKMKPYLAYLFLCLFLIQSASSKPLWGYIYYKDQSFKKVLFKIPWVNIRNRPDFHKIQKKVEFQYNFRSYALYPWEAEGFLFTDGQDTTRMISLDLASSDGALFCHLKSEGTFMLYEYFLPANPDPIYILINKLATYRIDKINFRSFIENYSKVCPVPFENFEISGNIYTDLPFFINKYNKSCEQN
tara:strand:- start:2 stop:574 length:573 start_codon:yes stop_codon:yes gene_type:complete